MTAPQATMRPPASDVLGPAIGKRVKELREHRMMKHATLARLAECTTLYVLKLEAGEIGDIAVSQLCRLAAALHCKPQTLLPEMMPARTSPLGARKETT